MTGKLVEAITWAGENYICADEHLLNLFDLVDHAAPSFLAIDGEVVRPEQEVCEVVPCFQSRPKIKNITLPLIASHAGTL